MVLPLQHLILGSSSSISFLLIVRHSWPLTFSLIIHVRGLSPSPSSFMFAPFVTLISSPSSRTVHNVSLLTLLHASFLFHSHHCIFSPLSSFRRRIDITRSPLIEIVIYVVICPRAPLPCCIICGPLTLTLSPLRTRYRLSRCRDASRSGMVDGAIVEKSKRNRETPQICYHDAQWDAGRALICLRRLCQSVRRWVCR